MEIQGFEKAGIVQSCLLLKCQGAKIGINRQPHFQIKLKEEELAQFLILRLYEKRDKSL